LSPVTKIVQNSEAYDGMPLLAYPYINRCVSLFSGFPGFEDRNKNGDHQHQDLKRAKNQVHLLIAAVCGIT
jgi:hypothetical protein